jgi:ATP phosphoribosyltransferase
MLRIAIQSKGRLNESTMKLLEESGVKLSVGKRSLLVKSNNMPIEILYLRDDDIPECVEGATADLGIVGMNEIDEQGADVDIVMPLGFGKCRLSLAIPREAEYESPRWFIGKTIATSYPKILQRYLTERGINAVIHRIGGSVEISPGIGLADAIFDIVSSGSTLISNNLKEVEVVCQSQAVLIANKKLTTEKKAELEQLLFRFQAVRNAEDKKYVRMNVPKCQLDKIIGILPGLKSPTVIPLADEEWCSVHTVLDDKCFWEIIGKLKELGAQGILVTSIEKMIF